jgi:nitrite reductase (NADH) large subunit
MAHVVGTYKCEWKDALEDPEKLARFRTFVNSPAPDPSLAFVRERAQHRPAHPHEKRELLDRLVAAEKLTKKAKNAA